MEELPTSRRVNPQKRVLEKTRQKSVGPAERRQKLTVTVVAEIHHRIVVVVAHTRDSRASPLLTRRRLCGRLRRSCRASWQEAQVAVSVGALVSPLSEHVSPEQPDGVPLV